MPIRNKKGIIRNTLIVIVSVLVVTTLFRLTEAGSLAPSTAPASSSFSFENLYQVLTGTFDSSAVAASRTGNALQAAKCIMARMTGGVCPATPITLSLINGLSVNLQVSAPTDCDGDGDTETGCMTLYCPDFLQSATGTYERVIASFGGETREANSSCSGLPVMIATCGDIGTSSVSISFCNGSLCVSDETFLEVQDNMSNCP